MDEYLSFRNFRQFERTRKEIRLPYDLLNDTRFRQLSDARKAHLLCLLLLAARMDNFLPNHRLKLERLIGATEILISPNLPSSSRSPRWSAPAMKTVGPATGYPTALGLR